VREGRAIDSGLIMFGGVMAKSDILTQIVNMEELLVQSSAIDFGEWLDTTKACLEHMTDPIISMHPNYHHAAALWFAAQRYYANSSLSIIRCQQSQFAFNLRHGIENTVLAAFMLGNPDFDPTTDPNATNVEENFLAPQAHRTIAHKWLNKNFPPQSLSLKTLKDFLNDSFIHGNVYLTHLTFDGEGGDEFSASLIDNLPMEIAQLFFLNLCQGIMASSQLIRRAAGIKHGFVLGSDIAVRESDLWNRCAALRDLLKLPGL
jgi:hypothetical protein